MPYFPPRSSRGALYAVAYNLLQCLPTSCPQNLAAAPTYWRFTASLTQSEVEMPAVRIPYPDCKVVIYHRRQSNDPPGEGDFDLASGGLDNPIVVFLLSKIADAMDACPTATADTRYMRFIIPLERPSSTALPEEKRRDLEFLFECTRGDPTLIVIPGAPNNSPETTDSEEQEHVNGASTNGYHSGGYVNGNTVRD